MLNNRKPRFKVAVEQNLQGALLAAKNVAPAGELKRDMPALAFLKVGAILPLTLLIVLLSACNPFGRPKNRPQTVAPGYVLATRVHFEMCRDGECQSGSFRINRALYWTETHSSRDSGDYTQAVYCIEAIVRRPPSVGKAPVAALRTFVSDSEDSKPTEIRNTSCLAYWNSDALAQ
jgi:hypothetical protein